MRIETERLLLDLHTIDDFVPLSDMWSDPETVRFVGGKAASPQESWMRLLRYRGLWPVLGYGYWALREKTSGRFVGDLGFADFHRQTTPTFFGVPEAGWVLVPWAHGKGYATEALGAALAWLDAAGHRRSVCIIDPANTPSLRLAQKLGYGNPSTIHFDNEPITLSDRVR